MKVPDDVEEIIKSLILQIQKRIEIFNSDITTFINGKYNEVILQNNIPTRKKFENYIFNCIKFIIKNYTMFSNVTVSYEDKINFSTNDIMFIVINGYQMPVHVNLSLKDNRFDEVYGGNVKYSVWINDYIAEKIN